MLDSLRIDSFRGLNDLDFVPLSRINVLTGTNNSGKTSVLEALYLLFADQNQLTTYPTVFRSAQKPAHERYEHFWKWLLPNGDQTKEVDISVSTSDKKKLRVVAKKHPQQAETITIQYMDSSRASGTVNVSNGAIGSMPTRHWPRMQFFSPQAADPVAEAEQYNRVQLQTAGEETLLDLLRVIEPRLRKLRYGKITKEPLVYADIGFDTLVPAYQMGQAFCRLLTLYMEMLATKAEILLVDEIENGLHHSVYEAVWKGIAALGHRQNIQIFVTSHSPECVLAAARAATRGEEHGFSHHRLEQFQGVALVNTTTEIQGAGLPDKITQIKQAKKSAQEQRPE